MKKIKIIATLILIFVLNFSYSQNESTNKPKYSFFNEYGYFIGGGSYDAVFGLTGVFVNGIRINENHFFGIGLGYESAISDEQSIPMFLNYRYFFNTNKSLKPLINIGLGVRMSFWNYDYILSDGFESNYSYENHALGLYSTIAAGFNVRAFSLTSGLFFKSVGNNYNAGFEIKVGYTLQN
jgi:hypothetical protein